jgi:hypothetical protein
VSKYNCWEFKKCGRGVGGDKVDESGRCPVAAETPANSLNGGINGGRICWVMNGNGCHDKLMHGKDFCFQCEFRYKVTLEEGLLNICKATGLFLSNSSEKKKQQE